jgi:hypothetical protein
MWTSTRDPRDRRGALSEGPDPRRFIVDDARRYVRHERRFDAVVVDVFSSHTSIPGHLVTRSSGATPAGRWRRRACCSPT